MKYPTLYSKGSSRQTVDSFLGYNRNLRIAAGEFYDMENMTSDYLPVMSPRGKRGIYAEPNSPQGLISKDALCYVDGSRFVINGYPVELNLSTAEEDCPKSLVSMGAFVIIMPDKVWINTLDLTDHGNIDASFTTCSDVNFSLCRVDGTDYQGVDASATAPEDPDNMDLWIDTSETPHVLKQYSKASEMWVDIAATYVRISSPGIGTAFSQYDGVTVTGVTDPALKDLNAATVIWERGDDFIVVPGILDEVVFQSEPMTVQRLMPAVDFLIESGNRLWGCRYGVANNGNVVNEIYASKLGDFKNWNCFMGLSTDSYYVSCGTDGVFTGAVTHLGYPLFFKENFAHKVYGDYPANFRVQDTALRGVQKGSGSSLAIVGEILYYKSPGGICAYDGSLPVEVSQALGEIRYRNATAGAFGNKYYISMEEERTGQWNLFVYDTLKQLWHREDRLKVDAFCPARNEMYAISGGRIITMLGSGTQDTENVDWMVESGELCIQYPDAKYISRISIRMSVDMGSEVRVFVKYDWSRTWEQVYSGRSTRLTSFSLPIRPKRCDFMRIRIEGSGNGKIYSITNTFEQGGEP